MKKNITISIFGQLYSIDEDAYELLRSYEESLRTHFSKQDDGAEISNDIEVRISELLSELKSQGTEVVTIEHVQAIIDRIGSPEKISEPEDESGSESAPKPSGQPRKRLFRDPENRVLAGVLAGLSYYFGGNVVTWRSVFVVPFLITALFPIIQAYPFMMLLLGLTANLSWIFLLSYVVVALVAPAARTPEERLQMRGVEVTPRTLADEVSTQAQKRQTAKARPTKTGSAGEFMRGCLRVFVSVGTTLVELLGVLFIIPCLLSFVGLVWYFVSPETLTMKLEQVDNPAVVVGMLVSAMALCFVPAYASAHALMCKAGKMEAMPTWQRLLLVLVWVGALVAFLMCVSSMDIKSVANRRMEWRKLPASSQGTYLRSIEWEFLDKGGWRLLELENCAEHCTWKGGYVDGDKSVRYLDVYGGGRSTLFQVERADTVENGLYEVRAIGRAEGHGAYIYAIGEDKVLAEIPPFGNKGGGVWDELKQRSLSGSVMTDREVQILSAHNGLGYGWSQVAVRVRVVDGVLRYGVSTDSSFTGKPYDSRYASAADFEVRRVE